MKDLFSCWKGWRLPAWAGLACVMTWGLAAPASAAFTDHGNGTVTDDSTGLMWMQCSRGQSGAGCATGSATAFTWADALGQAAVANAANELGHNDWRLPSVKELESLIDATRSAPAIDTTFFPNTGSDWHWSATTFSADPAYAWFVVFAYGYVNIGSETFAYRVRLVRGGQSFDLLQKAAPAPIPALKGAALAGLALLLAAAGLAARRSRR